MPLYYRVSFIFLYALERFQVNVMYQSKIFYYDQVETIVQLENYVGLNVLMSQGNM